MEVGGSDISHQITRDHTQLRSELERVLSSVRKAEKDQIMHKNEFEFSFWGFIRMIVPVFIYLIAFFLVFKACSKCCKRRGESRPVDRSRPNMVRRNSAPGMVVISIPPERRTPYQPERITPVPAPGRMVPTISEPSPEYQPQPPKVPDLDPPSYEEATHLPSYSRQLPYNPEFAGR